MCPEIIYDIFLPETKNDFNVHQQNSFTFYTNIMAVKAYLN